MDQKKLEGILSRVQKPGRYCGGEPGSVMKNPADVDVRFAFCFPDTYEVGMSHLGMKILYAMQNDMPGVWCERVFAPWPDMEQELRAAGLLLFALESRDSVAQFDIVGFTLQYELSFTNVLNMLDLAGIPLRAADRKTLAPLVIAGGPCACNPEPLAPFIDLFVLGEGEEVNCELIELYRQYKAQGASRAEFLRQAAQIPGIYVPELYDVAYHADGTVASVTAKDGAPARVQKRIVRDLDGTYYPKTFVVPYIDIVHDRAVQEIYRGCIRGCRFCQAGYIYRPVREKSAETVNAQARALCESTGYDELSLSSLSTSDYTQLMPLLGSLLSWTEQQRVGLSLPSLRVDNFPEELLEKIQTVKKAGLTFAPEAGTQRLRDAINKNITEQEILDTCRRAFSGGYTSVKLYFMLGLPTETMEDIEGIAALGQKIVDAYYHLPDKPKGKAVNVSISVSTFVPKPFTPFQFEPQDDRETILAKQKHLRESITTRKISLSWHDASTSFLEAVFARGDRRVAEALEAAWRKGAKFDGWGEFFSLDTWMEAFADCGVDPAFYANRRRAYDEVMPWDHLDYGISKRFLAAQDRLAHESRTTPNCRQSCAGCGAAVFGEGICREAHSDLV